MSDGVASFVVAGGVAAEALGGVCVGAVSASRLVLVCGQAELAVTASANAVSDHMLMLSNLGGAGRRRRQDLL